MISEETAAGLIASMLQGRVHIGPAWDTLDEQVITTLTGRWSRAIKENREDAVRTIIADIENHTLLGEAWERCGSQLRETLVKVMQVIICDTIPKA